MNDDRFKPYRKTAVQWMRPHEAREDLNGVSVNMEDQEELNAAWNENRPSGGMIAVNAANPDDKWYVGKKFFEDNYEPAEE